MSEKENSPNEWTLMFLFAGDNELAPLLISQVKAIKDAGFHENVEVLVHFDPNERGVPTRLLRVNHRRKSEPLELEGAAPEDGREARRRTSIGMGRDSFVRNMGEDLVRPGDVDENAGESSKKMKEALKRADTETSGEALKTFLGYCRESHPAENYMLFLFGHGMVVGSDAFLPDQNPGSGAAAGSGVTLVELGKIIGGFTDEVEGEGGTLHLLGLHSCAMSAIEVAYELKGTARYMIGAEGIAYVGSWPYLNLLIKIFNALEDKKKRRRELADAGDATATAARDERFIPRLVRKLYFHTLHNGTDFVLAGYSLDLALCSLKAERYERLTADIGELVSRLKTALDNDRGREMILLAHWESQSYWDENYTDLYDFCFCLKRRCDSMLAMLEGVEKLRDTFDVLGGMSNACGTVMARLEPRRPRGVEERDRPVVIFSKNAGSLYQYSHGLSVYFPWSKPLADEPLPPPPAVLQSQRDAPKVSPADILDNYGKYAFSTEKGFGKNTWLSFLNDYFKKTERPSRWKDEGRKRPFYEEEGRPRNGEKDVEYVPAPAFTADVRRSFQLGSLEKPTGGAGKPTGGSGSSCSCPTIKNYPTELLTLDGKRVVEVKAFYSSPRLLGKAVYKDDELLDEAAGDEADNDGRDN